MPNDNTVSYLVDPSEPDHSIIDAAARALKQGELIAYPTDTLYALGVDPTNCLLYTSDAADE